MSGKTRCTLRLDRERTNWGWLTLIECCILLYSLWSHLLDITPCILKSCDIFPLSPCSLFRMLNRCLEKLDLLTREDFFYCYIYSFPCGPSELAILVMIIKFCFHFNKWFCIFYSIFDILFIHVFDGCLGAFNK